MQQIINWSVYRNPNAALSALRDALLEAMADPQSPRLRTEAARYYAELMQGFSTKAGGIGATCAKKLLHHLFAAASHVDRRRQFGALEALRRCALQWAADGRAIEAAVESMRVVVLCLQASHLDGPEGLPTEALALQLGSRLLDSLVKAGTAGGQEELPHALLLQLWQGAGQLEPAVRGFCRGALRRLHKAQRVPPSLSAPEAVDAALSTSKSAEPSDPRQERMRSALRVDGGRVEGASLVEPAVIARALELLAARLDTGLWLAMPEGGGSLLTAVEATSGIQGEDAALARWACEESTLLVPRSAEGIIDGEMVIRSLARYTPRDRRGSVVAQLRLF